MGTSREHHSNVGRRGSIMWRTSVVGRIEGHRKTSGGHRGWGEHQEDTGGGENIRMTPGVGRTS